MEEVKYIIHLGMKILRIQFPDQAPKSKVLEVLDEAKRIIGAEPENLVYTLTVIGDFHYDQEITKGFEAYLDHNKPYVRAGAVLGINGLKKALYNMFMVLTKRSVKVCNTEEEALNFLDEEYQKSTNEKKEWA